MALEGWRVEKVGRRDIESFIERWHYSGNINGCTTDFCYALYSPDNKMMGAMFYGQMAMANQWKRFSDNADDVIELRRLCCVDDTPKNAESFFIGKSIRLLSKHWGGKIIVSYADKEYGHSGIIYRASNFECLGEDSGARVILFNDKKYHDKTIRTKYNGELKPFALKIKTALDSGEAKYKSTAGKVTYIYRIKKRKKSTTNKLKQQSLI